MRPKALLALLALALLTALTVLDVLPPAPRSASAPAEQFSASRAITQVEAIAKAPHPSGSAEHRRVREYLVAELRTLGLQVQVQEGVGVFPIDYDGVTPMGAMRNIVAVLPGTNPTGRVVLAAHYDSVPAGPGASDDGAGVATILEVARALPKGLRNDVVFLLTDGEEAGLLGADAFMRNDPLAKGNVVVLNNEARGVRGTVAAFRTSAGNGTLMSLYGSAAPHPAADSGFAAVMSVLPNNTDFFTFAKAGWQGIDSALVGGGAYYHSPLDDPAHLDRGSLQQMGDNTLGVARALAGADLGTLASGGESVYFNVPGLFVRYPAWLELPIALAALLAALALIVVLRRKGLLTLPKTLLSTVLSLVPIGVSTAVGFALWPLLGAIKPEYLSMFTGDPYRPWLHQAALLTLTAATILAWYGLRRLIGGAALASGAVLLVALLGVALAVFAPLGSHTFSLPALGASLGWLVALRTERWKALALGLGLAPSAILLGASAMTALDLGLKIGGVVAAALFSLLMLLLLPLIECVWPRRRAALVALGAAVLAVGLVAGGLATDTFDREYPRQAELVYALDAGTSAAAWGTQRGAAGSWIARYAGGQPLEAKRFFGDDPLVATGAPVASLKAPGLDVVKDDTANGRRTLTLRLTPTGTTTTVGLEAGPGASISVDGRELGKRAGFTFIDPPAKGLEVTLVLPPGQTRVRAFEEGHDLSVVPGYVPPPADTVNMWPVTTVFADHRL